MKNLKTIRGFGTNPKKSATINFGGVNLGSKFRVKLRNVMHNERRFEMVVHDNYLSFIEGKILTIIEGMGFENKQEEAVKSLIRSAIWGDFRDSVIHLKSETFHKLLAEKKGIYEEYCSLSPNKVNKKRR